MLENSIAITSFEEIESAAIVKTMVTNYYVADDFRKAGGIDCNLDWFVPSL